MVATLVVEARAASIFFFDFLTGGAGESNKLETGSDKDTKNAERTLQQGDDIIFFPQRHMVATCAEH